MICSFTPPHVSSAAGSAVGSAQSCAVACTLSLTIVSCCTVLMSNSRAVQLEEVYGEVFRVLKPGSYFCSYEWVATKEFDPNDEDHVRIIDEINFGNGLPVSDSAALSN